MDPRIKRAIVEAFAQEPFARALNMKLAALDTGTSSVEMIFDPDMMGNLFGRAHGGALFALIDEAFETSCQTHGKAKTFETASSLGFILIQCLDLDQKFTIS